MHKVIITFSSSSSFWGSFGALVLKCRGAKQTKLCKIRAYMGHIVPLWCSRLFGNIPCTCPKVAFETNNSKMAGRRAKCIESWDLKGKRFGQYEEHLTFQCSMLPWGHLLHLSDNICKLKINGTAVGRLKFGTRATGGLAGHTWGNSNPVLSR